MRILVGLSGGIDSSVAAYLLKKEGHEVEGATMLIWRKDSPYPAPVSPNSCYSPARAEDKAAVTAFCRRIGIPHHIIDCTRLYEEGVLEDFRREYMDGRTPNPCVWCNVKIKFGAMLDEVRAQGIPFDYFATGHYARITRDESTGRYQLRKAVDPLKDQSYFLYRLSQDQLAHTLFPLGSYHKTEVRKIDEEQGFHEKGAAESQDFYGGDYSELLGVEDKLGEIVMTDGRVVGHHNGYWHYTVGQRRGLGVAAPAPLYVLYTDSATNRVYVGYRDELGVSTAYVDHVVWTSCLDFEEGRVYTVKVRSASKGSPAYVTKTGDDSLRIDFLSPEDGVSAGQSAVVYDGDLVVAGGLLASPR